MAKQRTYYFLEKNKVVPFRSRKELDILKEERGEEIFDSRVNAEAAVSQSPLTYIITPSTITVSYKGQRKQVRRTQGAYEKVLKIIKSKKLDKIKEVFDTKQSLAVLGLEEKAGKVQKDGVVIPSGLLEKFIEISDSGKKGSKTAKAFFEKINKNPKKGIFKELVEFLKHNHMLFTEDGNIIGYKGVRSDFKDIHSGTFDNSPGKVCIMNRSHVVHDPNKACSAGLHVGSWKYASDFGSTVVEVLVDPRDIVSVPHDYNGQKMRVCKYKVLKQISEPRAYNSCIVKA